MKILLKNARILKMDDSPLFEGDIVVENDRIAYIGNDSFNYGPFDIERECFGNVLMPGFKNAHSHSAMTFLRSKADDKSLHDWLFDVVFPREENLNGEFIYKLSKVSYLEYLTSGITACLDQYFLPPFAGKAAEEMGMRMVLQGTYGSNRDDINECRKLYKQYNDKHGLVTYCYGLHAEFTTPQEEHDAVLRLIKDTGSMFCAHVAETKGEVDACLSRRGVTPIRYFADKGLFDNGGALFHCVHLKDEDYEIIKNKGMTAVLCPGSNTKLASGVSDPKRMLEMGINVALGTDGPASNNCLDMFKEMSLLYSLSNIKHNDPASLKAIDILKMATVNGSKAMNLPETDILEVGKKADIIEIDLHQPNMQPLNNIVDNIVYSGSKSNVKMTMIDGIIRYHDGVFNVGQDVEKIYAEAQEASDELELLAKK